MRYFIPKSKHFKDSFLGLVPKKFSCSATTMSTLLYFLLYTILVRCSVKKIVVFDMS